MADLNYIYSPHYGVEPFASNGGAGGARVTGDNLVITAWTVADKGGVPVFEFGEMLQPVSQNSNVLVQKRTAGDQAFPSRCSAQMYFDWDDARKPDPFQTGIVFVLNPPPELRQQLVGAVTFNGGDPLDLANYTVKKSLQSCYLWHATVDSDAVGENFFTTPMESILWFGTYLDLGDYAGAPATPLPLFKTNGADGQAPELFDRTTAQGVNEMIAAVNAGNFYIPLYVLSGGGDDPFRLSITYPHSTARG